MGKERVRETRIARQASSCSRVVSIEGRSDGERAWRISASHVGLKDEDKRIEIGEIMHGEIYREDEVYLSFKASKGHFPYRTWQIVSFGRVDVYSEDRKLLSTDELEWTPGDSMGGHSRACQR